MENPFDYILIEIKALGEKLNTICDRLDKLEGIDSNVILDVPETAKFLKIAVRTLYDMTSNKRIKFHKRNGQNYFFKEDLINYLKEGEKPTRTEVRSNAKSLLRINNQLN